MYPYATLTPAVASNDLPGEGAIQVSVALLWVEVEDIWLQVTCSEGVAESSSNMNHIGCAINLARGRGERCSQTSSLVVHSQMPIVQ